jgi:hypothetical protein
MQLHRIHLPSFRSFALELAAIAITVLMPPSARADLLPGFAESTQFQEQERWTRLDSGIRLYVNAPRELARDNRTLLVYATPNGCTIEQTLGCAPREGLHWKFDIQHVAAQVRRLRGVDPASNLVLAVVQPPRLAWPAYRQAEKNADVIIREIVASLARDTGATRIVLAAHSGGGSFLFGYINAADTIPDEIERFVFLDANYSYANDQRHGDKFLDWLKRSANHRLVFIVYDDRKITLNGKLVVGATGGTYRATERMLDRFRKDVEVAEQKVDAFDHFSALAGQIEIFIHPNPENKILHTALVGEMNGVLQGLTLGTANETKWGKFGGPPAYAEWITPQQALEPIVPSLPTAPAEFSLKIPPRPSETPAGSKFLEQIAALSPVDRESAIQAELARGNVPDFLRSLKTIRLKITAADGTPHEAACFVTPDYLAVGTDGDFFRLPMTPMTAQSIAAAFGGSLITTKLSDSIYTQSELKIMPQPLTKDREAAATFFEHHRLIEDERQGRDAGLLVAGIKKDVVLTNRLEGNPGKVAIYGWHYPDGKPIQPLYIGHAAAYVDYSHGIRLMSDRMIVDGKALLVADVLADPVLSALLSDEGPIKKTEKP